MQKGIILFQKYRQNKKLKLKSNLLLAATGPVLDLLPGEPCPTSSGSLPLFDDNTPSPLAAVCSLTFSGGGTSGASLPFLPPARIQHVHHHRCPVACSPCHRRHPC